MKIQMKIKTLREKLMNEKFIVRIRKKEDIVYYNGIKVFTLKENKNTVTMEIPENLYQYSFHDIEEMYKEIQKTKSSIADELKLKIDLLESFEEEGYFHFEMPSITFRKADDSRYSHEEMTARFKTFYKHLTEKLKIDLRHIDIEAFLQDFETKKENTITFTKPIKNIHDILYIQYYYYIDLKSNNKDGILSELKKTTAAPKFGSSLIKPTTKDISAEEFSKLLEKIKEVVETSNVKEYEKRYQFMFMLSALNSNLFGKGCYAFEQEYGFQNRSRKTKKEKEKKCRIDCVFFQYDEKNKKITDLYLIELKVDDSVVSGENGVLTHLDDINSLFFKKEKVNSKSFNEIREKESVNDKFFNEIRENIQYRMEQLYDHFEYTYDENKIDFNVHFYTIFGFTNEACKKNIQYVLENIKTSEGIEKLSSQTDKLKLEPYFKKNHINLETYAKNASNYNKGKKYTYDFKFFFDKDVFDYKDLDRENMNFIECNINDNVEKIAW